MFCPTPGKHAFGTEEEGVRHRGRNITVEGKKLTMPKFNFMHSFFISIGYKF
jgi:hypothetical protein